MGKKSERSTAKLPGFDQLIAVPECMYSGDEKNESVHSFIASHLVDSGYDADNDDYQVDPSLGSITASKRTPIYGLHSYDSKKPHTAVEQYIEHFTEPGDLVLDSFVGSGTTAISALLRGRKCVAIDASPLSTFVTASSCTPVSSSELQTAAERVVARAIAATDSLYETQCANCQEAGGIKATVYSQTYQCPRCVQTVNLYDAIKASNSAEESGEDFRAICPRCVESGHIEKLSNRLPRLGYVPVRIEYECQGCDNDAVREHDDTVESELTIFLEDVAKLEELGSVPVADWHPTRRMLWNDEDEGRWGVLWRPYHGEIRRVDQFFTDRNLKSLSALLAEIETEVEPLRSVLRFIFSGFVLSQSKLQRYHPGSTFPNMVAPGLLYVPPMVKEYNTFDWYLGKVRGTLKAFDQLSDVNPEDLIVSTQSAMSLDNVPSDSIDYVFTDPPYSGRIQYGELNFIQEAWLGFEKNWSDEEIIVSKHREIDESEWSEMLHRSMEEVFRVLKPGRWMTLCFHDSSEGTWELVQDILREVGFVAEAGDEAVFIDAKQKSLKQITSDKITKRDLVINVRKPRAGESVFLPVSIPAGADSELFSDLGKTVIHEFLTRYPGSAKDRIYDHLVSRMVKRGEMQAHNFDELLGSIAEEVKEPVKKNLFENKDPDLFRSHEVSRWYLKETADAIDAAEQDKEDQAAFRIEKFMVVQLEQQPEKQGIHYSELFEQVVLIASKDRPRRLFENWLPEYFFKTSDGTWRPPSDEAERQQKATVRKAGTLRRMKRFANALIEGVPVRDQDLPDGVLTLVEWIRQCRRAGLYEQGRALYEKGGLDLSKLDDEQQIEVEDDYRICVKRGSEDKPKKKSKKRKKKT